MKKTKDQIITELKETVDRIDKERIAVYEKLQDLQTYFDKLLFRQDYTKQRAGWENIKMEVAKIKGSLTTEGQMLPIREHYVKEENSKLWYLIRVAMNDKSIKEPQDFSKLQSKFINPDFN